MRESNSKIKWLILKYLHNDLSEFEKREFDQWLQASEKNRLLLDRLTDAENVRRELVKMDRFVERDLPDNLDFQQESSKKRNSRIINHRGKRWRITAVAAFGALVIGMGLYYWMESTSVRNEGRGTLANVSKDIVPGGNKAYLQLADGRTIELDSAVSGMIAQQGNTRILKLNTGKLAYSAPRNSQRDGEIVYNTIVTPPGGQYQVVLPDGSRAWINSRSSIRFPIAFTGGERVVEMTGEAYFEVAPDATKPFILRLKKTAGHVGELDIRVLGTDFNVMAYDDEPVFRATLVEGSIRLEKSHQLFTLSPGQQAGIEAQTGNVNIHKADIEEAVAWKNGYFYFNNTDLFSLLRQISRWYDIQVVYKGHVNDEVFNGQFKKSSDLSKVLQILKLGGVHFNLVGRTLFIVP